MPRIEDLKVDHCRSCAADIFWIPNDKTGKVAPIDVRPDHTGPIILNAEGAQISYHTLTKVEREAGVEVTRFNPHFMTCPNAASHHKAEARP